MAKLGPAAVAFRQTAQLVGQVSLCDHGVCLSQRHDAEVNRVDVSNYDVVGNGLWQSVHDEHVEFEVESALLVGVASPRLAIDENLGIYLRAFDRGVGKGGGGGADR